MHCIQCGLEIKYGICPSCKESPISLYEINCENNWNFCWNCGNHIEDDEEKCACCDCKREQIKDELEYTTCPECKNNIDPVFDCHFCSNKFIYPKKITYQKGEMNFIEKYKCPANLMPGDFYHDKKNKLNYKRNKNGTYTVSTQPTLNLKFEQNSTTYNINITEKVLDITGWKRLNSKRVAKLNKFLPKSFSLKHKYNKPKIVQAEIENWLKKCK